ncbi:MAG: tyrosine-type recombinase/integrase [Planctomycetota bacterium]|jgi:integrase
MGKKKTPKRKLWSVTRIRDPRHPQFLVRVTEMQKDGPLYFVIRRKGDKPVFKQLEPRTTRVSLGATKAERVEAARAIAFDFIERLAKPPEKELPAPAGELSLKELADKYEINGFHGRAPGYKRDATAAVRRLVKFLGPDRAVASIRPSDVQKYMAHRNGVKVAGRRDLLALSIALNWAVGEGSLEENPLARPEARKAMRLERHERRRPVATRERYEKLRNVAPQVSPAFGPLLDLAWHAGHRLGAILGLRWRDVVLEEIENAPHGRIRWYAGARSDRKKHEHEVPINAQASASLAAWQRESGGIGAAFVFPHPRDSAKPLHKDIARRWLRRAEKLAELGHEAAGGWHAFRRGWATQRKHLPLKDVAAAGGWKDVATLQECYSHADPETTRRVATYVAS